MAKIFVIDSENVGDSWIQLLAAMSGEDKIYVFYTDKSPYISYESLLQVIAYGSIPRFVKCHEGRNALDFQLVSELGYMLAQMPSEEFVIVSDDNGFDAVVRYWSEKNFKIRRIGRKFCRSLNMGRREGQNVLQKDVSLQEAPAEEAAVEGIAGEKQETETVSSQSENQEAGTPLEDVGSGTDAVVAAPQLETAAADASDELQAASVAQVQALQEEPLPVVYEVFQQKNPSRSSRSSKTGRRTSNRPVRKDSAETEKQESPQPVPEEPKAPVPESAALESAVNGSADVAQKGAGIEPERTGAAAGNAAEEPGKNAAKNAAPQPDAGEDAASRGGETGSGTQGGQPDEEPRVSIPEDITPIQRTIWEIVLKCGSAHPAEDARCVYEMFFTVSMTSLTEVNSALKTLIGNEEGNDIYRELKEHHECRQALDELYLPTAKERFLRYVQIVLDRSDLKDISSEELGKFLLRIPRKNLNSIRSSMQKEYGTELGSVIYTVYKPHIKVLNKIM